MDTCPKKQRRRLGYHYDTTCCKCRMYMGKIAVSNGGGKSSYICAGCKTKEREAESNRIKEFEEYKKIQEEKLKIQNERKKIADENYLRSRPSKFSLAVFQPSILLLTRYAYPGIYKYIDTDKFVSDIAEIIAEGIKESLEPEEVAVHICQKWYPDYESIRISNYLKISGYPSKNPFPEEEYYHNAFGMNHSYLSFPPYL